MHEEASKQARYLATKIEPKKLKKPLWRKQPLTPTPGNHNAAALANRASPLYEVLRAACISTVYLCLG